MTTENDGIDEAANEAEPLESGAEPRPKRIVQLKRADRMQAMALVENLLIRRFDRREVFVAVRAKFGAGLTDSNIDKLLKDVGTRWVQESAEDRPVRVESQRRALQRLYRQAESDKDWRVCIEVEKLMAKVDGTTAPVKVAVGTASEWAEMDGRSTDDLNYFAQHGYWPEQAPQAASQSVPAKANGSNGSHAR